MIHGEGDGLLGVVVAKDAGSIARRNTIRRRWREALRRHVPDWPMNRNGVFVVRANGVELRGAEIDAAICEAIKELK